MGGHSTLFQEWISRPISARFPTISSIADPPGSGLHLQVAWDKSKSSQFRASHPLYAAARVRQAAGAARALLRELHGPIAGPWERKVALVAAVSDRPIHRFVPEGVVHFIEAVV